MVTVFEIRKKFKWICFKPIPLDERTNKQSKWTMFVKANSSAVLGAPLSFVLNIIIAVPIVDIGLQNNLPSPVIALMLLPPFYTASVIRQFLIDLAFALYNVDVNPSTLIKKLIKRIKNG